MTVFDQFSNSSDICSNSTPTVARADFNSALYYLRIYLFKQQIKRSDYRRCIVIKLKQIGIFTMQQFVFARNKSAN